MQNDDFQPISRDVLLEKYAKGDERSLADIRRRVARALAAIERDPAAWEGPFLEALESGFIPAGRVMSAAGTDIQSTLINCFVQPVGDSMLGEADGRPGIMVALAQAAETMRRGGGVGYDFSPVRPQGARVAGTGSRASGPVSYMRVFDRMCETVESAGARRGAQMGILRCDHPDIETFVHAKDARGELTNFNISVAVTDAFMAAVESDAPWDLVHPAEPGADRIAAGAHRREDGLWVYRTLSARALFDTIVRSTYDHAEPGVFFVDRANAEDNLAYCERLSATNPCVTGDPWVMTDRGPRSVLDLVGKDFGAVVDGRVYRTLSQGFFATGEREVFEVRTEEGYSVRVTGDHKILKVSDMPRFPRSTEWIAASELKRGDRILLHDHRALSSWDGDLDEAQGYLLGLLVGDGHLTNDKAVISVWEPHAAANGDCIDRGAAGIAEAALEAASALDKRADFTGWQRPIAGRGESRLASSALRDLALRMGMGPECKSVTPQIERSSRAGHVGFLRGLLDSKGSVQGTRSKDISIRLAQSNMETLSAVQRMLHRLGIRSRIYSNRKTTGWAALLDGRGGSRHSPTLASHELVISKENVLRYRDLIGFRHAGKRAALDSLVASYRPRSPASHPPIVPATVIDSPLCKGRLGGIFPQAAPTLAFEFAKSPLSPLYERGGPSPLGPCEPAAAVAPAGIAGSQDWGKRSTSGEPYTAEVLGVFPVGKEPVYDVSVESVGAFDANGIYVHNCGEQPLPDYGCCCLGSIDLTRFVRDPFCESAHFDSERLSQVAAVAVRMLDNVLDLSHWPLPEQRAEAMAKRRVGLGFTGLGDALIMLGLRYDSDAARQWAGETARALRDAAYSASADLAAEKGQFPLFDADRFLSSGFANRLTEASRKRIRESGLRNSHLLSIAPTGTISLAFADNASNGIEPAFSWTYIRRKRRADGGHDQYRVEDHAYRLYRELGGDTERLPAPWVTALEISALDHMRMLEVVQPYVDAAISKTVNVPADYPFADFRDLYREAWRAGLKGLSTFRPNPVTGEVLSAAPAEQAAGQASLPAAATQAGDAEGPPAPDEPTPHLAEPRPGAALDRQDLDLTDTDRRLRLDSVPRPALASLRWRRRPRLANGNPAWTYLVDHPLGSFAIVIGHLEENGRPYPFEVWVNGAEQPRGLGALAKSLSMDMRSDDRGWLAAKLGSLMRAAGDDAFDLPMPPSGEPVRVPSLVAGFARLVHHRCQGLRAFDEPGPTPVLDALMSPKEPKTGTDGTLSWTVDLLNPATGDDFVMGVKELVLPDGSRRPYSIWLSGVYPRVLDGLCKSLSYDMRVIDPAWIGAKLRQIADLPEPRGDFLAREPGRRRQRSYPSTVAYLAVLLMHRYGMLGILDAEGYPVRPMGVVEGTGAPGESSRRTVVAGTGRRCEECGSLAVIPKDGCDFCTVCGALGACG